MRQTRKITVTASLELDQLERLQALAHEQRVPRSIIVRAAIERELARYETKKKAATPLKQGSTTARPVVVTRP